MPSRRSPARLAALVEEVKAWNAEKAPEKRRRRVVTRSPEEQRRYALWHYYRITPADYEQMFQQQGGTCVICTKPFDRLHVDHDHETGKVRGLLCSKCNSAIGLLDEDVAAMARAIEYVTRNK